MILYIAVSDGPLSDYIQLAKFTAIQKCKVRPLTDGMSFLLTTHFCSTADGIISGLNLGATVSIIILLQCDMDKVRDDRVSE